MGRTSLHSIQPCPGRGELATTGRLLMLQSLRPLLETALDAVVVMHRDGTVAAWNAAAERTFGWSEPDAGARLHGLGDAEARPPAAARTTTFSECAHVTPFPYD